MNHKSVEEQDFGNDVFTKVVLSNKIIINTRHPAKEREEIHTDSKEKTA